MYVHAMPCDAMPMLCCVRQQRSTCCCCALRLYPRENFPFSFLSPSYNSASCCPSYTRDHEEFAISTATTYQCQWGPPCSSPCTTLFTAKDGRPFRGLNAGSTQRHCLGFPPLCPDCLPWGNLPRVPARGQDPSYDAVSGGHEAAILREKSCAPMWLAGLPCFSVTRRLAQASLGYTASPSGKFSTPSSAHGVQHNGSLRLEATQMLIRGRERQSP